MHANLTKYTSSDMRNFWSRILGGIIYNKDAYTFNLNDFNQPFDTSVQENGAIARWNHDGKQRVAGYGRFEFKTVGLRQGQIFALLKVKCYRSLLDVKTERLKT